MNTTQGLLNTIICDDHPIVLEGLSAILSSEKGFHIQKITQTGEELLQAVSKYNPDIILIDAHLKNEIGFDLIHKIKSICTSDNNPNIFIITSYMDEYMVSKALQNGATGCISKSISGDDFIQAIKYPKVVSTTYSTEQKSKESESKQTGIELLTQRERDIIHLISYGHSSKKIAEILCISIYTVETHKKNIYRKLKFNSATELLAWYYANKDILSLSTAKEFD
jgi:DNA-binding NarL/FixJ family response regulator